MHRQPRSTYDFEGLYYLLGVMFRSYDRSALLSFAEADWFGYRLISYIALITVFSIRFGRTLMTVIQSQPFHKDEYAVEAVRKGTTCSENSTGCQFSILTGWCSRQECSRP